MISDGAPDFRNFPAFKCNVVKSKLEFPSNSESINSKVG